MSKLTITPVPSDPAPGKNQRVQRITPDLRQELIELPIGGAITVEESDNKMVASIVVFLRTLPGVSAVQRKVQDDPPKWVIWKVSKALAAMNNPAQAGNGKPRSWKQQKAVSAPAVVTLPPPTLVGNEETPQPEDS